MFKSSFAQEILEETKHHNSSNIQDAILPIQRHSLYKSQFAASTHGPLDNIDVNTEDEPPDKPGGASKYGNTRPPSVLDNINIPGNNNNETTEFQTSDLGTSDFSSSEIWPSTSSSPFEYTQRYRRCSFGDSVPGQVATQNSFLNLQSSMQFSYLKRACMELDLGLGEDDWNSIAANLLKDFNKNVRNIAINTTENFVNLGDFLSELQSYREEKRRRKLKDDNSNFSREDSISEEELNEHLSSKALTAKLAAKELETLQVRLECQQLYNDNLQLREEFKQLKQISNPKKYLDLQKEIEHLHWQLNKMENSRKLYELATGQLVTFLEQVSSSLTNNTSRGTLAELGGLSSENISHAKRLSLASLDMARSQSMPGLVLADTLGSIPKNRRISAREKRVRRSSSVSKTRVSSTSPLPSLAEQEDPKAVPGQVHHDPVQPSHARSPHSDNQSTDSFPLYRRSNSVSDPLCVSTPKTYKSRLKAKDLESDSEVSKRGTLTSLSSSSSASPPSTDTSRSRDNCSTESMASVGMVKNTGHSRSMSSLLAEPKVLSLTAPQLELVSGEQKVVLASKASRLLKTVKLMLAREKSYNVSSAEGRKRGRKLQKSGYQSRSSSGYPSTQPLASGAVLRTTSFDTQISDSQDILDKAVDKIEISEPASVTTGEKNKVCYPPKQDRIFAGKEEGSYSNHPDNYQRQKIKKTSRRDSCRSSSSLQVEQTDEDNCVMCLQEKELIRGTRGGRTRASCREESVNADIRVDRSKSDAQDKVRKEKEEADTLKNKSSSSKFIKRSRSFSRIFNYSMLNRSKEYRL